MLKTPKAVGRMAIIVPLSKCFSERQNLAAHTKEILFSHVSSTDSHYHMFFKWLLFLKNIKTIMFFQCCMLFFSFHSKLYMHGEICSSVACHCTCPSLLREEGGRHIESYAAALAITAVDRSGACELACLSGCLSPLGQNISLPLKPLPPGLCHHSLSLSLSF